MNKDMELQQGNEMDEGEEERKTQSQPQSKAFLV
jgi:hypothetical protein